MTLSAFHSLPASRQSFSLRGYLPGIACALLLLAFGASPALAASKRGRLSVNSRSAMILAGSGEVTFPAASVRPVSLGGVGPILSATGLTLTPNDIDTLDPYYNGPPGSASGTAYGAILNFSVHGTGTGAETVLTSSTVGSGVPYGAPNTQPNPLVAVSPAGLIYYYNQGVVNGTTYDNLVMLDPTTLVRTIVSDGSNASRGPVVRGIGNFCWDLSTNTIVYIDFGANSTPALYRVDPATGIRTAIASSGVAFNLPAYLTSDAFGNLFYIDQPANTALPTEVIEIPVIASGAGAYEPRKVVSGQGVGTGTAYIEMGGVAIDFSQPQLLGSNGLPAAQSLIVTDAGNDQMTSAIYRVSSSNGNRVVVLNDANNKASGTTTFDFPEAPVVDTTGKIYYVELHNYAIGNTTNVNSLNYLTLSPLKNFIEGSVQNVGPFTTDDNVLVPPPQPALAAGTVSGLGNGTATLNSSVTADGGVANSGIITRGFVYALTSANARPRLGGAGVTKVVSFQANSLPVTQGTNLGAFAISLTGLPQSTSYTFSAFAQDVSGYTYTAPVAFITATLPTVTTPTATGITGVSATLGGNVTADGGAALTARGIVYSATATNGNPIIGATGVTNLPDGTATTGVFTDGTGNVMANGTAYSYKAYATNSVGTAYSPVGTFTTTTRPTANAQAVTTAFNTAKAITLTGSDPNTPAQTLTYAITASPAHGTLTGTAPNLTYTPTANYQGADSFQFTTTNTGGLTSTAAAVSITVSAGTPTANTQTVNTAFNTATAVTLTGTDPDSPALALTYTVAAVPTHGTLSGTAPNLTYTPSTNTQGADSFTFTVNNGQKTSAPATVSITVAAGTPTANAQTSSVAYNGSKAITLTGSDPDKPALTLTYTVATAPTHGTLSGTPPNLIYTPASNFAGSDSFTFTVSNGQKTSAPATVSITVTGVAPTITSANTAMFNGGVSNSFTVTTTGAPAPIVSETGTLPSGVTFTANGDGTATLSGAPAAGSNGSYAITITAHNTASPDATQTFTLVINRAPVPGVVNIGATQGKATSLGAARLVSAGSDADGDPLTVTATSGASAQGGTVTLSASGNSGTITYTSAAAFTGPDSFTYTLNDGRGGVATGVVNVTVTSGPFMKAMSVVKTTTAVTVAYAGVPGNHYQPQYIDALDSGTWTNSGPVLTADGSGGFTYVDGTQPQPDRRFYRAIEAP